jgi:DNA repair photolyase
VVTKGTLVERDLDLMTGNPCAKVVLSFCTLDDKLAANFDLNAPLPSRRWRTLETLVALGIETEISLKPWIPGVTDIDQILERVPSQVSIRIERLKIVRASRKFPVGNRVLSQVEIDKLYLLERAKYSGYSRLIWEMDVRFSQFSDAEEHPLELAMRQNQHEFGLLQKRGKLSPQILTEVMSISG